MMVNDHHRQPNIEAVRELLSPYLDGEVTTEERALVEAALAASVELREDLATLRQTVALLAELPPVAAPRPFTLTAADVPVPIPTSRRIWGLPAWLAGWAMAAASLICVLAIGGALFTLQFRSGSPAAEIARMQDSAVPQAAAPQPAPLAATEEAAAQPEAELAPAEPAAEEKMMLAEPAEALAQKEADVVEEPQKLVADETPEEMVSMAGESEEVTEGQRQLESVAESAPVEQEAAGAALAPTPSPMPTVAALEAPAPIQPAAPAEEAAAALAEEPASAPPPAAAEARQAEADLAAPEEAPLSAQDEFLATAEPQPTATFTPTSTPSIVVQVTPSPSPSPSPSPPLPSPTPATSPDKTGLGLSKTSLTFLAGLVVLGGLVLLGLAIWLRRQKQQN